MVMNVKYKPTKMKKIMATAALALIFTSNVAAQNTENETSNYVVIDMPVNADPGEAVLMQEYNNRTYLRENINSNSITRNSNASERIIIERLKRIPTTMDLVYNDITKGYINKYANQMKRHVGVMLASMNFYRPIFEEALERYGLPYELQYLPIIESSLKPSATSPVGAAGLWQFMPSTGKTYGLKINTLVDERRDPIKSTDAACRFLKDLYDRFGDWSLAIAAYNCGPGAVQKALSRAGGREGKSFWDVYNFLPRETRGYVPAFIGATYIMTYYCEHGITPMHASLPEASDTILVEKDVRLSKVATTCGISLDQLKSLNPQYRQDIIPASSPIRLPEEMLATFIESQETLYSARVSSSSYAMNTTSGHSKSYSRSRRKSSSSRRH